MAAMTCSSTDETCKRSANTKNDPPSQNPEDYRPISLLNAWYKILDRIVKDSISADFAEHQTLSEEQADFREGRSCQDQIFILETASDLQKKRGKSLILCLIDLKKAFDKVDRGKMYHRLKHMQ